ncbi:FRIGIDA-like protein 5 [Linum grandiflorum]
MEGEANVDTSLTVGTGVFLPPQPATMMQSRLREKIKQVRHHASWIDSFAASLESTVDAAVEAQCNELRLALAEEKNANERLKEKTLELKAKEDAFDVRMKKEIELLESEKAVFKKKLQELEEKEEEFETLGSYVEERAIQVRKTEEQMEDQRKEIEECFRRFEEQSVAFNLIQSEFQVRLSELAARENQLKEIESKLVKRIEEVGLREKLLEEKEKEVESKQSEFQVRLSELDARENQCKEIESKLVKRIEEVELREKEVESEVKRDLELKEKQVVDHSSTANFRICVTMNGKDLQIFLNERSKDGSDLMKDEAKAALKLSSEPAKLVLDAMEGFYPPHLKKGDVEFEEGVIRNSCLMLLEELTRMSPEIKPTVRKEAMKVACDWMSRMKCDADHSIEVLALLQLMAAFGLASSFDDDELVPRVRVIAHYSQAPRLLQDLGLANKISV